MSPAQCATESNPLVMDAEPSAGPNLADKTRKRVFLSFAGTMLFGLALAGWYVGDRILAAETIPTSAVSAEVIELPANIPLPMPPASAFVIPPAPKEPEFYLQTTSLGDRQDLRFLKQLQLKGYAAKIDDAAILIGPYADRESLEHARRKLAGAGILAVEPGR
jgi:hypothetical protein